MHWNVQLSSKATKIYTTIIIPHYSVNGPQLKSKLQHNEYIQYIQNSHCCQTATGILILLVTYIGRRHYRQKPVVTRIRPPVLLASMNHNTYVSTAWLTEEVCVVCTQQQRNNHIKCFTKRILLYFKTVKRSTLCVTSQATGARTRSADRLISVEQRKLLQ